VSAGELHPLARQFDRVADQYDLGRPEYAPAAIGALAAELGLRRGDAVLDLAAGTGKLTAALLAFGLEVTAVEPQPALRSHLVRRAGEALVLDARAESLPLAGGSFAAVTVADAFHWFDRPQALREIHRVLAPQGGLAIIDTVADWRAASWEPELAQLLEETRSRHHHPHFDDRPWTDWVAQHGGFTDPWRVWVSFEQSADAERILAHLASFSWIAALAEPELGRLMERMRGLIEAGGVPELVRVRVEIGMVRRRD
jgi:ubiquinone/menaquinone biosynthesis C-methylase UbiE